jgi:hypothetical protein
MERRHPYGSWRSLIDQEFLAFLSRIAQGHQPEEPTLLLTDSNKPLSTSASRWIGAHPEISMRMMADPASLPKNASTWAGALAGARIVGPALPSWSRLRSEVQTWVRTPASRAEPFAWIRD